MNSNAMLDYGDLRFDAVECILLLNQSRWFHVFCEIDAT